MNDRRHGLKKWWLCLPLLFALPGGLWAQCAGPFNLACIAEIEITLKDDCRAAVTYDMVVTGLPECLGADNFSVGIADSLPENLGEADGPGRFRYAVTGQNNPDLIDFTCWGYVTVKDDTPPTITLQPDTVVLSCSERDSVDFSGLPAQVDRCYRVDGATGAVVPGTLAPALRKRLETGTALPLVTDACGGEVEVCVRDAVSAPVGSECFDTVRMVRTYTATQLPVDSKLAPAESAQVFFFLRPQVVDLRGVEQVVFVDCSDFFPGSANPSPRKSDYPFFQTSVGPAHLSGGFCNYQVIYRDGERIAGCGDNFSFVRTFHLVDWCGEIDSSFTQVVSVGDLAAPVITPPSQDNDFDGIPDVGMLRFPTNTSGCAGILNVRSGGVAVTDACDSPTMLEAYVYLEGRPENFPLGPYPVFSDEVTDAITDPIPVGQHLLRYVARDACGNTSATDVYFEIYDATPPLAICEDGLNVALNGNGLAILSAGAFDGGSVDACGPLTLRVALVGPDDVPLTALDEQLSFSCEDTGPARVVLEATDRAGNANRCWLDILVEDKIWPVCVPPADVTLTCTAFAEQFRQNLVTEFAGDPHGVGARLDAAFGAVTGVDNCGNIRSLQSINGVLNNCGVGQLSRYFRVVDGGGLLANNECRQLINVVARHEYTITFPGDQDYDCTELPEPEDLLGEETGCDLLLVTTDVDTLTTSDPASCYKLLLTHDVINWCEYDGFSQIVEVPRDADGDGNLTEPVYLHVAPLTDLDLTDDRAILDRDDTPFNGNDIGPLLANYGTSSRRGYYRYRQFVGVYDRTAPELSVSPPETGLAFTQTCLGGVSLNFTATDDCHPNPEIQVAVDTEVTDRNGDGRFTSVDFRADRNISAGQFTGDPAVGVEVFIRNLPIGRHLARVSTSDGCGNRNQRFVVLTVRDAKAPTPACVRSVTTALSPDPVAGGVGVVWANDFVASPAVTCTETEVTYAIYPESVAAEPGFVPSVDNGSLNLDCGDLGEMLIRVYAIAANNGRYDFCNAVINITDNSGMVCTDRRGTLSGRVLTEAGIPLEEIAVYNDGPTSQLTQTDEVGEFFFDGLLEGQDYTIQPYENSDPLNGVTTRDITMIARYLLLVDDQLTPYQLIAADANRNREITVRDLITIRRAILGIQDGFDNNTSWRFIPKDYEFPDPDDPFLEVFPEVGNFNDLVGSKDIEFVAVKTGDLDRSARIQKSLPGRGNHAAAGGKTVQLTFRPARNPTGRHDLFLTGDTGLAGLQFSMDLPAKSAVIPGLISADEYHLGDDARLHVSFAPARKNAFATDRPLLSFVVKNAGDLPELVLPEENGAYALEPEGYDESLRIRAVVMHGGSDVAESIAGRVVPNPMPEQATLLLNWTVAEEVSLQLTDLHGRSVVRQSTRVVAGANRIPVNTAGEELSPGVYYLRVRGGAQREVTLRVVKQ